MRVLVVTAHLPPNLTSGGSVVPLTQARTLAARGHEVEIISGWVGDERPTGTSWTEPGKVPVHWLSTTAWTRWTSHRNWDNRRSLPLVREVLSRFRPDVVHAHALQGLGGRLVDECASAAPVVVTMHDFWWSCARQFLVDRAGRPCCPVVLAGACRCESGRRRLERRDADLAHWLDAAGAVVAASSPFAAALVSNGVDPARVRVVEPSRGAAGTRDQPGLDGGESRDDESANGGPLRLLFAGGPDPMKGWPVLVDALARVPDTGWRLTAHGLDGRPSLPAPLAGRVDTRPAFAPDERSRVLAGHDVLVLPSVAAESYSLLAREALDAGLAVVTTDAPGPLDVVRDGVNGLVVPRGDADALASALRRLVTEPALVRRLRPQPGALPVRSAEQEAEDLERVYAEVLATRAASRSARSSRRIARVLFVVGIGGAPMRYRARLPAEALGLLGVAADVVSYRDRRAAPLARAADAVVLYRVPATQQVLALVDELRARCDPAVPVLFDVDDLIVDPGVEAPAGLAAIPESEQDLWWQGVRRYRMVLDACDAYVGSTDALCARVTALTGLPARPFANGVGRVGGALSDIALTEPRRPGPPRIGYFSGTPTHDADWASVEPAVLTVMRQRPEVQLWLGGRVRGTPALDEVASRVRRIPPVRWDRLPRVLRDVDVNLAPLADLGPFNEAKSAIKWMEATLVGTASVCSPTAAFRQVVVHGSTGLLASTVDEWARAIDDLLGDPDLAETLAAAGRRLALTRFGPWMQGRRYLAILEDVARTLDDQASRAPAPAPHWPDDVLDEPPHAVPLEPYRAGRTGEWADRLGRTVAAGRTAAVRAGRAPRVLLAEGPRGVLRRLR